MKASLTLFERSLQLVRYPEHLQHPSWQAWDAADEYIIEYLQERPERAKAQGLRIYNDDFGALTCWFAKQKPTWISDSYVALRSCQDNLALNNINSQQVTFCSSMDTITTPTELVLLKIPKTTALLEQQLIDLQDSVGPQTLIIAAAKASAIQKSTLVLFEKYLGITTTSLAKKKARLVFCQPSGKLKHQSPYPTHWFSESPKFELSNHANVFARQQLDIGARFMLQHLPKSNGKTLIDLGCGNGVLGLSILYKYPDAKVIFVDESYMALASAKENLQRNLPEALPRCEFLISNCLDEFLNQTERSTVDIVLCNPPFHQQNAITDHIALQMFSDAKKALVKGGELVVVGNRHLDYPVKLKRLFNSAKQSATNQKFSIFTAIK
ncbi:methyltransferase [Paraglaciecola sp.]|uniref:methyltransferase n=1 Tax=Paraglaciecola sp. TaxID=1920173 RepID=UPI0030F490F9